MSAKIASDKKDKEIQILKEMLSSNDSHHKQKELQLIREIAYDV